MADKRLTVARVVARTHLEAEYWVGKCYGISSAILKAGLVPDGRLVYGHWTGPAHKESIFYVEVSRLGFCRHGWIERADKSIVDATRWVFEAVDPYIYEGPNDHYDEGGDLFRASEERPAPEWVEGGSVYRLARLKVESLSWLRRMGLTHAPYVTEEQIFWLANLSRRTLKAFARPIYREIIRVHPHGRGLIPIDNQIAEGIRRTG